ncbi:MAG: hypothetical protein HC829_02690, partial [Bacteroidales bacterium]|nr:hypothetical protein [Bacteroidales bacterium]
MPGTMGGIDRLKQDESRHIAYGIFLISRLVAEHPDLWEVAENQMNMLLMPALGTITEAFEEYDPIPFGLTVDDFTAYAMMQFQKRMARIEQARGASVATVAVAWTLAWPGVTGAIVGARSPGQVDGWFDGAIIELTRADLDEIAHAIAATGAGAGPAMPG